MSVIHILDRSTVDMIAAGEVIERPVSVVKELIENAIDAGAKSVSVEIRQGGIEMIRVTDDGCGIARDDIRNAFHPHATSKISSVEDLFMISTLGFRGEALASIAAVSRVHMVTRTADALSGVQVVIYGGKEESLDEVGAPEGTTVVVRDLFYNTPARKKFLKSARTEAGYIGELIERMALACPDVQFHYIRDKKDRLTTSGNGDYRELIYRIYGKEAADAVQPLFFEEDGYSVAGYLGEPVLNRANRNQEVFFVNGRYVRDKILSRALEEGYEEYLMQHRFPFAILMLTIPPDAVDVNAHPSKLEVRFHEQQRLSDFVRRAVHRTMHAREMIPEVLSETGKEEKEEREQILRAKTPEPFERARRGIGTSAGMPDMPDTEDFLTPKESSSPVLKKILGDGMTEKAKVSGIIKQDRQVFVEKDVQMNLFDVRMLTEANKPDYRILGQVFGTYWILVFRDKMYLVDQHAAHEKVNYERMMKRYHDREMMSQLLNPPLVLQMTEQEETLFKQYEEGFRTIGYQVEPFGAHAYAMRAVPIELFGADEKELFLSILDELRSERGEVGDPSVITHRIATMACKASVKGNTEMTGQEMEALIDELLTLDNPYHCPHGRPTIISMSKVEIDRKFKRIV